MAVQPPVIVEKPLQSIAWEIAAWNEHLRSQAVPAETRVRDLHRDTAQKSVLNYAMQEKHKAAQMLAHEPQTAAITLRH